MILAEWAGPNLIRVAGYVDHFILNVFTLMNKIYNAVLK